MTSTHVKKRIPMFLPNLTFLNGSWPHQPRHTDSKQHLQIRFLKSYWDPDTVIPSTPNQRIKSLTPKLLKSNSKTNTFKSLQSALVLLFLCPCRSVVVSTSLPHPLWLTVVPPSLLAYMFTLKSAAPRHAHPPARHPANQHIEDPLQPAPRWCYSGHTLLS